MIRKKTNAFKRGKNESGKSYSAERLTLFAFVGGTLLFLDGMYIGGPLPSNLTWQMVVGPFLAMAGLLAQSSVYMFKSKSPQIFNQQMHQSLWSTVPMGHTLMVLNGKNIKHDIFLLGGYNAFGISIKGGRRQGVALIPSYLYDTGGMTINVAADYILWPYAALDRNAQRELDTLPHFNKKTTPIYWFCIANEMYRTTLELHRKDKVYDNIYDIFSMLEDSEIGYNQLAERLNTYKQTFQLEDKYMRRGRRYEPKQNREDDSYE